jgi:non-heme chloroperoxidase
MVTRMRAQASAETAKIRAGLKADRPATLMEFLKNFYSVGGTDGERVSERVVEANWAVGIGASPIGTLAYVDAGSRIFARTSPAMTYRP